MSFLGRWFGRGGRRRSAELRARIESLAVAIDERVPKLDKARASTTRLSLLDELIRASEELQAFELQGEPTISPPPSQILPAFRQQREELIRAEIETIVRKAVAAQEAADLDKRVGIVQKALQKAAEWEGLLPEGRVAQPVAEPKALLHVARLEAIVEEARRHEFKGDARRALDLYQEALYLVLNDEVPDEQQQEEIHALDAKIRTLSERRSSGRGGEA